MKKGDEVDYVAVSMQIIRLKAMSLICPASPSFKAFDGWIRKFMKRNDLVVRTRTHISQALPKDLEQKIETFHEEVKKIMENSDYPPEYIANMDETLVFLDSVPTKTVDREGKKSIWVQMTASGKNKWSHCAAQLLENSCHPSLFSRERHSGR